MKHGDARHKVIDNCVRLGKPIPEPYASEPELEVGLDIFITGFKWLTTCRASGMGEGPIPWTAIRDYCLDSGLEGEQKEDFYYHIDALDTAYLEYRQAQAAKESAKAPK